MTAETHDLDRKSLKLVTGAGANFGELAKTCVCFANGAGGHILIGIEDDATEPPPGQRVEPGLLDKLRKRIAELTVNVQVHPELRRDANGGDYIALAVARSTGVASTSDGRYFARIGDSCQPVVGDDVLRLISDRPSMPWETLTALGVQRSSVDAGRLARFARALRSSGRVKASVAEKSEGELLDHYGLAAGPHLTNLGVLLLGSAFDRMRLGTAPVIQAIKYDDRGLKVDKHVWDDYSLAPADLIEDIWRTIPDFRESYELPDGMFRTTVPAFEEVVVRELLVNALVHRPYTQRGDIFLNLHPDRLEVVNPGRLPLGITPQNILHATARRNDGLARVFHDLGLMEREGSGFDLLYERLLATGRRAPAIREGTDSVTVVVERRVLKPAVAQLVWDAERRYQLTQRERITLGLLAQTEGLTASALAAQLELREAGDLATWLGRLPKFSLVATTGRTRATRYHVPPQILRSVGLDHRTTLARVEPHRLRALIEEDLARYPGSSSSDVHRRIGSEVHPKLLKRVINELIKAGKVVQTGTRRWTRYSLAVAAPDKAR